jgi:hypothetical protein
MIVGRLRWFLLALAAWMCLASIIELILSKHYKETTQLLPFVLCGLGLVAALAVLFRPSQHSIRALRAVMGVTMLGSLFGIWEHIETNFSFELDMRPGSGIGDVWLPALQGAAPLLAPGILAVAALMAIAATYYHPALRQAPADHSDAARAVQEQRYGAPRR